MNAELPWFLPALFDFLRERTSDADDAATNMVAIHAGLTRWMNARGIGPAPKSNELKHAVRRAGYRVANIRRPDGSRAMTVFGLILNDD